MKSMTDQYYSRLLSTARENKKVKIIKEIKDNQIHVELTDGSSSWMDWEDIFDYKKVIYEKTNNK